MAEIAFDLRDVIARVRVTTKTCLPCSRRCANLSTLAAMYAAVPGD